MRCFHRSTLNHLFSIGIGRVQCVSDLLLVKFDTTLEEAENDERGRQNTALHVLDPHSLCQMINLVHERF